MKNNYTKKKNPREIINKTLHYFKTQVKLKYTYMFCKGRRCILDHNPWHTFHLYEDMFHFENNVRMFDYISVRIFQTHNL